MVNKKNISCFRTWAQIKSRKFYIESRKSLKAEPEDNKMRISNILILCFIMLCNSSWVLAKDQYVIWLGGIKGVPYAHQNQTAVDRAVLMIEKLRAKGVSTEDIIVHASSGGHTEVITPDRSISGMFKKSFTQINNYKNKGSLEKYLAKKGIKVPSENLQVGTIESVKKTLRKVSAKMNKSGSDELYLYVTQGKEDGYFGRNELDNKPNPNNGIYAVPAWNLQDALKLDNFKELVVPQIAENGKFKNILKEAETNVQLKKLLLEISNKAKITSAIEADELFLNNHVLRNYASDLPNRLDSINELRTLYTMKPEAREQHWANKVADIIKEKSKNTTIFASPYEIDSLEFQELIMQFRANDKDSKITVYNEIDSPLIDWFLQFDGSLTQPKFSNVCEYNSPLISDKNGHKTTKIFAENLFVSHGSNFQDAVWNTEKFKRKNNSKWGMEGKTSVHHFIAFLFQKYKNSAGADTTNCISCNQQTEISPAIAKGLASIVNKKERDDLKAGVMRHFKVVPGSEKNYLSRYLSFMDKMTEAEIKQLENLLSCFDPKWKDGEF